MDVRSRLRQGGSNCGIGDVLYSRGLRLIFFIRLRHCVGYSRLRGEDDRPLAR